MLFTELADTADGQWPLAGRAHEVWDELVSVGLANQLAIDRIDFEKWLAASGWDQSAVATIADQFFADSRWLAKRLSETVS